MLISEQKYNIRRLLLVALSGSILIGVSQIFTDSALEYVIEKVTAFHATSIFYELWKQPPYQVYLKFYIFNVTNRREFLEDGEKLKFNEIGPYVFEEILMNLNSSFNENGTLTFHPRRLLQFRQEKSVGGLNDTFISPNIPLLGLASALHGSSMVNNLGIASITSYLDSQSFLNISIYEYLFGFEDPLISLANTFVPSWIDFDRFGLLDRIMALDNSSDVIVLNTAREDEAINKDAKRFTINRWNGSPGLPQWGYNEEVVHNSSCTKLEGAYTTTMLSPNLKAGETLNLYRHAFCRHISLVHHSNATSKDGFEGFLFKLKADAFATKEKNPDNDCYCRNEQCLPDGLVTVAPCYYGIPITMSQPHFMNSDPILLKQVDGLSPDVEKHDSYMLLHPKLGIPLDARVRVQISLAVPDTQYNLKVKPFNNLVIPMIWIEMAIENVPSIVHFYLTILYDVLPILKDVLMYLFAVVGCCMVLGSAIVMVFFSDNQRFLKFSYSQVSQKDGKLALKPTDIIINK